MIVGGLLIFYYEGEDVFGYVKLLVILFLQDKLLCMDTEWSLYCTCLIDERGTVLTSVCRNRNFNLKFFKCIQIFVFMALLLLLFLLSSSSLHIYLLINHYYHFPCVICITVTIYCDFFRWWMSQQCSVFLRMLLSRLQL